MIYNYSSERANSIFSLQNVLKLTAGNSLWRKTYVCVCVRVIYSSPVARVRLGLLYGHSPPRAALVTHRVWFRGPPCGFRREGKEKMGVVWEEERGFEHFPHTQGADRKAGRSHEEMGNEILSLYFKNKPCCNSSLVRWCSQSSHYDLDKRNLRRKLQVPLFPPMLFLGQSCTVLTTQLVFLPTKVLKDDRRLVFCQSEEIFLSVSRNLKRNYIKKKPITGFHRPSRHSITFPRNPQKFRPNKIARNQRGVTPPKGWFKSNFKRHLRLQSFIEFTSSYLSLVIALSGSRRGGGMGGLRDSD